MNQLERINNARHAGNVVRFHTSPLLVQENVGQHTFNLVNLLLILTEGEASKALIFAALTHDMGEYVVGDIPSPMKNSLDLHTLGIVSGSEDEAVSRIHPYPEMPDLTPEDIHLLRLCDNLDGLLKCTDEMYRGNMCVVTIGDRYRDYIVQLMSNPLAHKYDGTVTDIIGAYDSESRRILL